MVSYKTLKLLHNQPIVRLCKINDEDGEREGETERGFMFRVKEVHA